VLYLTYWFREREQAQTIALFMAATPFTSIIAAPVSGLILDHAHWLGLSSWRWLLIMEGFPAIVCGFFTDLLLPNRPGEAKFLTPEEFGTGPRRTTEGDKAPNLSRTGVQESPSISMTFNCHRFLGKFRVVFDGFLDASVHESSFPAIFEYHSRNARDGPLPHRT
jgi:MFS family permease